MKVWRRVPRAARQRTLRQFQSEAEVSIEERPEAGALPAWQRPLRAGVAVARQPHARDAAGAAPTMVAMKRGCQSKVCCPRLSAHLFFLCRVWQVWGSGGME